MKNATQDEYRLAHRAASLKNKLEAAEARVAELEKAMEAIETEATTAPLYNSSRGLKVINQIACEALAAFNAAGGEDG